MTKEEIQNHQLKQTDLKQWVQILTPLMGLNDMVDSEVKALAVSKMKELIPQIQAGLKESAVPFTNLKSIART